jgi:MATE family multidrug resistance protein
MIHLKKHIVSTFQLAYPVIIGQLGIIMMGVVDSLMVGSLAVRRLLHLSVALHSTIIIELVFYAVTQGNQ